MENTIKNLARAFVGESQARNRYTFYSKIARDEGFQQIAEIFLVTADNEREHASWLMKLINQLKEKGGNYDVIRIEAEVPTVRGTTVQNLKAAIAGENYEYVKMYPGFADEAQGEGLVEIAQRLRAIARAEEHHEERFKKLLKEVEAGTVFKKEEEVSWVCRECGYVFTGKEAPMRCPSCDHEQSFYQRKSEEY